eukprot:TRINITY_DN1646_c3_g1_i1.p1 TRINITY_DN1646_c3_g1~~TRINITY_DN1646_c3_g1_i1.p1  ORF type:complete len:518 (+),score=130.75 TRINITY_DN1646_c3_g1_i1:52-1605(+)
MDKVELEKLEKDEIIRQFLEIQNTLSYLKNQSIKDNNDKEITIIVKDQDKKLVKTVKNKIKNGEKLTKKERKIANKYNIPYEKRKFDFSKYVTKKIAFKVLYLGWNYHGLAYNTEEIDTVEKYFFKALIRAKLIEDRSTCNFDRSGRTDTGVSAFSQVFSLNIRTNELIETVSNNNNDDSNNENNKNKEKNKNRKKLEYCKILNSILPDDIRVIGSTWVDDDFSARFSCTYRTYKYFFIHNNLNIEKMQEGCNKLIGGHDFRNFCKIDAVNVMNYKRTILGCTIQPFDLNNEVLNDEGISPNGIDTHNPDMVYTMTIKGYGFLWHQVRCIFSVLRLIGQENEEPDIIDHLTDVDKIKARPKYPYSEEYPLVLWDCGYDDSIKFIATKELTRTVQELYEKRYQKFLIDSSVIKLMSQGLNYSNIIINKKSTNENDMIDEDEEQVHTVIWKDHECRGSVLGKRKKRSHVPLLERPTCASVEDQIKNFNEKKRMKYQQNLENYNKFKLLNKQNNNNDQKD